MPSEVFFLSFRNDLGETKRVWAVDKLCRSSPAAVCRFPLSPTRGVLLLHFFFYVDDGKQVARRLTNLTLKKYVRYVPGTSYDACTYLCMYEIYVYSVAQQ